MPVVSLHPECPKGRDRKVRLVDGGYGRASCHSYACPVCGRHKVKRKAVVLNHVAKTAPNVVWVTLTGAPRSTALVSKAMIAFKKRLTRKVGVFQMGWVTEIGDLGGWHVHGLFHGPTLTPWAIEEAWPFHVKVDDTHDRAARYMLKGALECVGSPNRAVHFQLNAGRPFRHTAGFFGDAATFEQAWREARQPAEPNPEVIYAPVVPLLDLINCTPQWTPTDT